MQHETPLLQVDNLAISFGREEIIKEVSFSLGQGEIGCLL